MVEAIFALNLDLIKRKLMDKSAGHGWTRRQADHNEVEYKRFLVLLAKYPDQSIAPSTEVNKFWHGHILDTMKYAEDCDAVFGYFMHHFPDFGTRGEQDAANLVGAFMNMQRLYDREFGEARQVADADEAAPLIVASAEEAEVPNAKATWCAAISGEAVAASKNKTGWHAARAGAALQNLDKNDAWYATARTGLGSGASAIASRPTMITGNERAS